MILPLLTNTWKNTRKKPFKPKTMNEEKYIQGFNSGYILAEHKPETLKTIMENLSPTNEYLEGMFDGQQQQNQEKVNEQMQSIEYLRNRSLEVENERQKD